MRTEHEIREKMQACNAVAGWGMSDGPCPFSVDGSDGCCAECSTCSTLEWVLGDDSRPSRNGQDVLVDMMAEKETMTTQTTEKRPSLVRAKSLLDSCDFCEAQEEGGHYCLLHACDLKNANLWTCADFKRSYRKRKTRDESNSDLGR